MAPKVFHTPNMRRVQTSNALSVIAQTAWIAVMTVVMFNRMGVLGAAMVVLLRQFLGASTAPLFAVAGERFRKERVLASADTVRVIGVLIAVPVIAWDGATGLLLAAVIIEGLVASASNAVHDALLPWVATSPEELVSANAFTSIAEIGGFVAGGSLCAVAIFVAGPASAAVAVAVIYAAAVVLLLRVRDVDTRTRKETTRFVANIGEGVRQLRHAPDARIVAVLLALASLLNGLSVSFISAVSQDLLGLGNAATPMLIAVVGIGGLVGGVTILKRVRQPVLAPVIATGIVLCAAAPISVSVFPNVALALAVFVGFGIGAVFQTLGCRTLLQRLVEPHRLAPIVGVTGLLGVAAGGVGAIIAIGLNAVFDLRTALRIFGAATFVIAAAAYVRLKTADRHAVMHTGELAAIESVEMFHPLGVAAKTQLASLLTRVECPAGTEVVHQGDAGDSMFIVASGTFGVYINGDRVHVMDAGDHFGEIALLYDTARTATVRAEGDAAVWELSGADFLEALLGNTQSHAIASAVAEQRWVVKP